MVIISNNVSETMSHLEDVSEISDSVDESEEGEIRSDSEHESYFTVKATTISKAIRAVSDELCPNLQPVYEDSVDAVHDANGSSGLEACNESGIKSFDKAQNDVKSVSKSKRSTSKISAMRKEEDSEDELELRYIALRSAYLRGMQEVNQEVSKCASEKDTNASLDKENSPVENNHPAENKTEKELFLKTQSINKNFDPKDPRNACSLASEILKQIEKSQKIAHKSVSTAVSSKNRKRSRKKSFDNLENMRKRSKVMKPDHRREGSLPEPSKTDESIVTAQTTDSDTVNLADKLSGIDHMLGHSLDNCSLSRVKSDGDPEYIVLDETDEDVEIIHESVILKQPFSPDYIRLDEPMDTQSESGSDLPGLDEEHSGKSMKSVAEFTVEDVSFGTNEDEDEDEELLRANLLMDIAQKQREKEKLSDAVNLESELEHPEKIRSPSSDTSMNGQFPKVPYNDRFSSKKNDVNKGPILNVQELARKMLTNSRVIINLNESDDTSSSDDEDCNNDIKTESVSAVNLPNGMESQVDLLLKSARNATSSIAKRVLPKSSIIATPKAICHLPVSKQREYRVLKQKLKERQLTKNNSVKRDVISASDLLKQVTINHEPDEVPNEETLQQDTSNLLEEKINTATDTADFNNVDNTDILQLSDKVLQDCNSLIVNIKSQQEKSPMITEGVTEMDKKTRRDRLLQSLKSMEMRVLKQRDAVHVSLSNISDLLGVVAGTETEVKVLSNRQKELQKELSDLEMSLTGKKSFITSTNLEIKNAFVKVQKQKSMLQTNENKCIKYGKILRGANYNLPRKVTGKPVSVPGVSSKHGRKGPVHRRVALRSKINNRKSNMSVSTDVSKRRVVLKQSSATTEGASSQPSETVTTGEDYVSPLDHLRNKCPANMNPNQVLCHFELMGHCNDDSCEYQHHNRQGQSSRKHNPL